MKDFAIWCEEGFGLGGLEDEDEVGAGAELAGACEDAID